MLERILIPTDGSEQAAAAIDYGLELAEIADAEVHALYVVETKAKYILTVDLDDREMQEFEEYGEGAVGEVVSRAEALGLAAEGAVRRGKVANEIVEYAMEEDIDQIVMGRRGQGAIGRYLGTTAEKVVHMSEKPVTIVEG